VLHRFDCGNLLRAKQKDEQWLEVDWQADDDEEFEVLICIQNVRLCIAMNCEIHVLEVFSIF
jgi:(p)ppGpp synthase/HD superfamily hydrolase